MLGCIFIVFLENDCACNNTVTLENTYLIWLSQLKHYFCFVCLLFLLICVKQRTITSSEIPMLLYKDVTCSVEWWEWRGILNLFFNSLHLIKIFTIIHTIICCNEFPTSLTTILHQVSFKRTAPPQMLNLALYYNPLVA